MEEGSFAFCLLAFALSGVRPCFGISVETEDQQLFLNSLGLQHQIGRTEAKSLMD